MFASEHAAMCFVYRLFEAYTNCSTEKERNVLLAELKFGPTKR